MPINNITHVRPVKKKNIFLNQFKLHYYQLQLVVMTDMVVIFSMLINLNELS